MAKHRFDGHEQPTCPGLFTQPPWIDVIDKNIFSCSCFFSFCLSLVPQFKKDRNESGRANVSLGIKVMIKHMIFYRSISKKVSFNKLCVSACVGKGNDLETFSKWFRFHTISMCLFFESFLRRQVNSSINNLFTVLISSFVVHKSSDQKKM